MHWAAEQALEEEAQLHILAGIAHLGSWLEASATPAATVQEKDKVEIPVRIALFLAETTSRFGMAGPPALLMNTRYSVEVVMMAAMMDRLVL